jgi:hypothetical protein
MADLAATGKYTLAFHVGVSLEGSLYIVYRLGFYLPPMQDLSYATGYLNKWPLFMQRLTGLYNLGV